MDVDKLRVDELDFELLIRGLETEGNGDHKRKILRSRLRIERSMPTTNPLVELDPGEHLQACDNKLIEVEQELRDTVGPISDNVYKRLHTRLVHAHGRVDLLVTDGLFSAVKANLTSRCLALFEDLQVRYQTATSVVEDLMAFASEALVGIAGLGGEIESPGVADVPPTRVRISTPVEEGTMTREPRFTSLRRPSTINNRSTFVPSEPSYPVNNLAIHKWGITFNGDAGLSSFLERIEELRAARGVSKGQLFTAAVEFFSGNALVWFRSIRDTVG